MLRRKMLFILGSVVILLVVTIGVAMWLLQDVLEGQDHISSQAMVAMERVNEIDASIASVRLELYRLQLNPNGHLDGLIIVFEVLRQQMDDLGQHYLAQQPKDEPMYDSIRQQMPLFERHVGALATTRDAEMVKGHHRSALDSSVKMQAASMRLGELVRNHVREEQTELTSRFRRTVVGLTIVFLVVINLSVLVLLRMASMVVQPVETLVAASRELGLGHFGHRVHVNQGDEFDELAQAFNELAQRLELQEEHRIEVLGHVAATLNHELNNASAIIELQLRLLGRRSSDDPDLERCLRQIHESLKRMHETVEALKHVRRIVLTDYVSGVKMLDLQRSIQMDSAVRKADEAPAIQDTRDD